MLNISLMQCYFFKNLLGFLYNLAGFQSNIKESQEKTPAKFCRFSRAKPQLLSVQTLQNVMNKNFECVSVAKKIVILELFSKENFLVTQTVEKSNNHHFPHLENQKSPFYKFFIGTTLTAEYQNQTF